LEVGSDETGLFMKYVRCGSGYYIDIEASELVANGDIKLAHGQISQVKPQGIKPEDGPGCRQT